MATAVLTRSYDNARTGACLSETVLTPAAIAQKGLRRVRSFVIDDDPRIEAQPLYVPHIRMPDGNKHDVLFVASMGNHVWAFDVHGSGVWKTPLLGTPFKPPETQKAGEHRSTTIDSAGINIHWGILSTPVIDLDTQRMYLVNWMMQPNGKRGLFAHRIDLSTMQEIGTPDFVAALELAAEQQTYGAEYLRAILSETITALPTIATQQEGLQSLGRPLPAQETVQRSLADYEQYVANRECVPLPRAQHMEVMA